MLISSMHASAKFYDAVLRYLINMFDFILEGDCYDRSH